MKRSLFSFLLMGFSLLVVGISISRSRAPVATLAADTPSAPEEQMVVVSEVKSETEEYPLPYPGILPDHPLYFLKMGRDRVQLLLTRQQLAKAKLLLHYADKRIAASLALAEKGKVGLAVSTATKAEKYLEQAIDSATLAETQGDDTRDIYHQLFAATEQHEKVLLGVLSRIPDEAQTGVVSALEINERSHEEIESKVDDEREDLDDEMEEETDGSKDSEGLDDEGMGEDNDGQDKEDVDDGAGNG